MVAALLVALVVPVRQAHAGHIIGIQGGYVLNQLHSVSGSEVSTMKRSDLKDLKLDQQGGFVEFNYDFTFGIGKKLYYGFGPYLQWQGTKSQQTNAKLTNSVVLGFEQVIGFTVVPLLDISLRAGFGFLYSQNPDWSNKRFGVNWRVLPGFTVKFGKIGIFLEAGYVGNWTRMSYEKVVTSSYYSSTTKHYQYNVTHGAQVGMGVKLYFQIKFYEHFKGL